MRRILKRALCATVLLGLIPSAAVAGQAIRPGLAPAAFASVPLAVLHTPFDARWSRVLHSGIGANAISNRAGHLGGKARLQSVNTAANHAIAFREDRANGKDSDYWTNAGVTLARGSGDCEDYAIAKFQLLLNAGVPSSDIFLVIGNDLSLGLAHAMLIVHQGGTFWVLDSLTDEIRRSESYTDFRPIMSFGTKGAWLHGYAVGTAPSNVYIPLASRSAASGKLGSVIAAQRRGPTVGRASSTGGVL